MSTHSDEYLSWFESTIQKELTKYFIDAEFEELVDFIQYKQIDKKIFSFFPNNNAVILPIPEGSLPNVKNWGDICQDESVTDKVKNLIICYTDIDIINKIFFLAHESQLQND